MSAFLENFQINLHAWLFSNPCGKVLIIVGISWSLDLRVQHMFHSEILASLNFNKNKIVSPGLENNHTHKCFSGNFPT